MLQNNRTRDKSLFSRVVEIFDVLQTPPSEQKIIIANQVPLKPFTNIAKKITNHALYLKQINSGKPNELPVMAS